MNLKYILKKQYLKWMEKRKKDYLKKLENRGLQLGNNVNIVDTFFFDPSHCYLIEIGDNCTICPNVRLIAHDASTFNYLGYTKLGKIKIGENCFIGDSSIILPKVTIGENSIIGAGSVVTKDIPPESVAAGNPAQIITSLTDYLEKIERLRQGKNVFDQNYWINFLNHQKRIELTESIGSSIGFIV